MARLTQRQRIFVDRLFCGFKQTAAARRAGYSNRGHADAVVGHRLAHNEKVQAAIREEPPACLDKAVQLAARNPNTRLVIDHLGLPQSHEPSPPAEPFAELSKLLALAVHNNVAVKISGACTLSHEPFTKTSGTHSLASSTPLASIAACGAPTGPRGWNVDLRARSRGVSRHRPAVRQRAGRAHGDTLKQIHKWPALKA